MCTAMLRWSVCILALVLAAMSAASPAAEPDRVLIVVSGEGRDEGRTRPGFEMDEFSQAWLIFRSNGLAVDVASPAGGAVEADRYNPNHPFNADLLADGEAMRKLADTRATADVRAEDYAAVYVVGGKGAMFDLPVDPALQRLLADVYQGGGIVAAVCHGPAALVEVRLADGSLLVAGRNVTGFSNDEETVFGKKWAKEYPFLIEDAMRARGANWQHAPLMMPKLVVDGRLITGQNPYSTPALAEAIVSATGRTPVAREPWRDELSMALVQRLLSGEAEEAHAEIAESPARFNSELIAMLGFYQLKVAQGDAAIRDALSIMQLAEPYMPEPRLKLAIADAYRQLGNIGHARALAGALLENHPDMEEARQLLDQTND